MLTKFEFKNLMRDETKKYVNIYNFQGKKTLSQVNGRNTFLSFVLLFGRGSGVLNYIIMNFTNLMCKE